MTAYKLIQLTNTGVGAVPVNEFIPLGVVTRRLNAPLNCCNTFSVESTESNTIVVNDYGFYKITYELTATAAAAGEVTIALVTNGTTIYSVSQTIVDETTAISLTLPYVIRVSPNSTSPVNIQIQNTGIALTGSSANLIVEKL